MMAEGYTRYGQRSWVVLESFDMNTGSFNRSSKLIIDWSQTGLRSGDLSRPLENN